MKMVKLPFNRLKDFRNIKKCKEQVQGFHGCDKDLADRIIQGNAELKYSKNSYDWLGHGVYFWEYNCQRAYQFAIQKKSWGKLENPAVVGAYIDLGYCLNLTSSYEIDILQKQHKQLERKLELIGEKLPQNKKAKDDSPDFLFRYLDCKVIQSLHYDLEERNERPYDSVRGVFIEGSPIYEGSGIYEKTHIQLCIRNMDCIKKYFIPECK